MAMLNSAGCYPVMNKNHKKSFLRDLPSADNLRIGRMDNDVRMINFDVVDDQYYIEYYPPCIVSFYPKNRHLFPSRMTVVKVRRKSYTGYVVSGEDAEDWLTMLEDKFGTQLRT